MKTKQLLSITILSFLFLLNISCQKDFSENYDYNVPQNINDGLETGNLAEVHMDSQMILKAISRISEGKYKEVHSLLIFKNNKLVVEEYFKGHQFQWDAPNYYGEKVQFTSEMIHDMMSVTKSFTSACIGIAIDKGFIDDVNQSIFDYLPNHQNLKTNNREYITIEHLLTMTGGLAWNEWSAVHGTSANDIDMLYFDCQDPITCVLERGWFAEPGDLFTYNGGGMVIIAEILKNASGMNIDEFSRKYLFDRLEIEITEWTQYENGMYDAAGSLKISPRSMVKFGVTYLNDGTWNDERILSPDWIDKSSKSYNNNIGIKAPIEDTGKSGYGYSWWTNKFSDSGNKIPMYRASGWGGQSIMVIPDLDMVIVFTGANYSVKSKLFQIVERFILPSMN